MTLLAKCSAERLMANLPAHLCSKLNKLPIQCYWAVIYQQQGQRNSDSMPPLFSLNRSEQLPLPIFSQIHC